MSIDREKFVETLSFFAERRLLGAREVIEIQGIVGPTFPFARSLGRAESIHVHVRVDDVASLPHEEIRAMGSRPVNAKDGYVKYPFAGGLNMIFSSVNVAQDDLLKGTPKRKRPFVDHYGIDLREESSASRVLFDEAPSTALAFGWRHVSQGEPGKPVYCCHVEVAEKHWLYPPRGEGAWTRPIELAYGALKVNGGVMGCDLRPIDPAHPQAGAVSCCAPGEDHAAPSAGYYDPKDLGRFAEMGRFASATMAKFFEYYQAATSTDGALTKREKSLIALAVAHAKQCPYCIEAYTAQCLATGSNPEQMHEAVHVAAALSAGIDLVHGVQMQNALRARAAIE